MENGAQELRQEDWHRLPRLRRGLCWLAYQAVRWAIGMAGFGARH
jgi:cardiolipin synthase